MFRLAWLAVGAAIPLLAGGGDPAPLRGAPLGKTGLRLVIADDPPFVLDVDTGTVTPVRGIPVLDRPGHSILPVGGRAAVVVVARVYPERELFAVRDGGARVSSLGTGSDAVPAADGRSVWVKRFVDPSTCTLRRVGLDGAELRAPRPFPCASTIDAGGSLGVVVNRTRVFDPVTERTVLTTPWGVLAAAGATLVLAGPGTRFTVLDATTGARRRQAWPSILSRLDAPAVDPRGRFLALAFADPSWSGSAQASDVWLLDTRSGELIQLPGMPAIVSLKRTSIAWTDDGRLVLFGESDRRKVVAVWRPGDRRVRLKTVRFPGRSRFGDSFAPVR